VPSDTITVTITVNYLIVEEIVSQVTFLGRGHRDYGDPEDPGLIEIFDDPFLRNTLKKFTTSTVLQEYGLPTAVYLQTLAEHFLDFRQPPVKFRAILLYPDWGTYAVYTTEMEVVGNHVMGCFANAHISLDLFPLDAEQAYWEWVESRTEFLNSLPLEQVTDLSIAEFHRAFSQEETDCIVSPAIHWPKPEN
jgi:hypothetical protein